MAAWHRALLSRPNCALSSEWNRHEINSEILLENKLNIKCHLAYCCLLRLCAVVHRSWHLPKHFGFDCESTHNFVWPGLNLISGSMYCILAIVHWPCQVGLPAVGSFKMYKVRRPNNNIKHKAIQSENGKEEEEEENNTTQKNNKWRKQWRENVGEQIIIFCSL